MCFGNEEWSKLDGLIEAMSDSVRYFYDTLSSDTKKDYRKLVDALIWEFGPILGEEGGGSKIRIKSSPSIPFRTFTFMGTTGSRVNSISLPVLSFGRVRR